MSDEPNETGDENTAEAEFPPELGLAGGEVLEPTAGMGAPAREEPVEEGDAQTTRRESRNHAGTDESPRDPAPGFAGTVDDHGELELRARVTELEHWRHYADPSIGLLAVALFLMGGVLWMILRGHARLPTGVSS